MRKLYFAVLTLALCIALLTPASAAAKSEGTYSAIATNNTIAVSNSTDTPDAHLVYPAVYKIEGANYFKLRDLAKLLNGSEKQFSVDYDDNTKAVSITSGKPYTAVGGELFGTAEESRNAIASNNTISINGESVTLTVFKIDGGNYFKLRDLGKALDFYVGYHEETKTVYISGAKGYEEESTTNGRIKIDTTDVKNGIAESIVSKLQNEITFEAKDILTFSNGTLESIDIKSTKTAEILFRCIRNCVRIEDLTGAALEPMQLPIQINGQSIGTFECLYIDYPETGQFLCIVFSPEDSAAFYEYVTALDKTPGVTESTVTNHPSGFDGEKLYINFNGKTLVYERHEPGIGSLTRNTILDTFDTETEIEGIVWEVYSAEEYPDLSYVLVISGTNASWTYCVI